MRFELTIDCDNAAFADDETGEIDACTASRELSRIVGMASRHIGHGELTESYGVGPGKWRNLHDENGNLVGRMVLRGDEDEEE